VVGALVVGGAVVAGVVLAGGVLPAAPWPLASLVAAESVRALAEGDRLTITRVISPIVVSTAADTTAGRLHQDGFRRRRWERERVEPRPPPGGPETCVMHQTVRAEYFILLIFSYRLG
jgi:hypothetical protein